MPIHNYECEFCGHLFEELIMRESDEAELVCPKCGATKPGRRLSVPAKFSGGASSFAGMGGPGCVPGGPGCNPGGG
ncbi:MAG: zinc ribbon domain-containing protein [Myxococcota bacterium]|jgi:putative FmdB family regulatory protein|nr:zinc ribbon domain-containing protein [Myxococcota bacterium]